EELRTFNIPVLTHIPLGVVVNEAAARGVPVTTFAPETIQAVAFQQIALVVDAANNHGTKPLPTPHEPEFVFEEFIADLADTRAANDKRTRHKLYDLLPKRQRPQ